MATEKGARFCDDHDVVGADTLNKGVEVVVKVVEAVVLKIVWRSCRLVSEPVGDVHERRRCSPIASALATAPPPLRPATTPACSDAHVNILIKHLLGDKKAQTVGKRPTA